MTEFVRYAIYYAPPPGAFADRAAAWLGWDIARGSEVAQPAVAGLTRGLDDLTAEPRRYGFHGTVKPPFRLAPGRDAGALRAACADLCAGLKPVVMPGLALRQIGGFVALVPEGDTGALSDLAARVVRDLDTFRAPPTEAEIARRNPARLTDRQRRHLADWGYPYVMEDFAFHLTLSGPVDEAKGATLMTAARAHFGDTVPAPFALDSLCLCGEGADGRFRLIHSYTLSA
jgi:putative phosphonate metabolism protein